MPPNLRRLVTYAICGGCGVALDFVMYTGLVRLGVWYQFANLSSYLCGTILSFFLNRSFTFNVQDAPFRRFISFLAVAGLGYTVSSALLWALVEKLEVNAISAKAITLIVVFGVQYTLNSLLTFRKRLAVGAGNDRY
jgi:putative flippase GtrA